MDKEVKSPQPRLFYSSFCDLGDHVNPFKHRLNLTNLDYAVSFLLGLVLVPVRVILVVLIIFFGWFGAAIFTTEWLKNPEGVPNSWLRLKTYEIIIKLLALTCGIVVTVEGMNREPSVWLIGGWPLVPMCKEGISSRPNQTYSINQVGNWQKFLRFSILLPGKVLPSNSVL